MIFINLDRDNPGHVLEAALNDQLIQQYLQLILLGDQLKNRTAYAHAHFRSQTRWW